MPCLIENMTHYQKDGEVQSPTDRNNPESGSRLLWTFPLGVLLSGKASQTPHRSR